MHFALIAAQGRQPSLFDLPGTTQRIERRIADSGCLAAESAAECVGAAATGPPEAHNGPSAPARARRSFSLHAVRLGAHGAARQICAQRRAEPAPAPAPGLENAPIAVMSARAANNGPGAHPSASKTVSETRIDHGKGKANASIPHERAGDSSLLGAGFAHGGGGCRGRLRGRAGTSGTAAAALCIPSVPRLRRGCRRLIDWLLQPLGQPWRRWIRLLRCVRICANIAPSAELRPATAMSRRTSRGRTSTARAGL